jgi:hypothetical protein
VIRDAIQAVMIAAAPNDVGIAELQTQVEARLGRSVAPSSIRSSLNLNKSAYVRTSRGRYRYEDLG